MADKQHKKDNKFRGLNRPTAGARSQKDLPVGQHPIQLYSLATPNGQKVTTLLLELGLAFDAWRIHILKGEQFTSGFVSVNPNSKIPAMVDKNGPNGQSVNVFESGSILLYLAEKTGRFIPSDPVKRVECLNWVFHQMGSAPYFGQFGHFYKYTRDKIPYAIERYTMEVQRLLSVLDIALEGKQWLCGDELTIADFAWIPWVLCIDTGYAAKDHIGMDKYKNVNLWAARWLERPKVAEGMKINSFAKG
eukprot:CAMPEP_0201516956 /NCGR_PEP_ID=MMETSP0161_2-20130828/8195_1 /ASSEMBLY_ACC=CAM_ASM_000251 /TAXON_ID=180227 /ORGANISM="Neoparamoeba aestuarina, Strain SoJaBio B1-5/56/2" /LENGTH=247 /DNA_ID=CAMNT_0047914317 /DNA_START=147 /DNA_END=886 /DNA_ORIENTATION=+